MSTIFIVNGQEKELRYDVNGIDISGDFIGNTSHGMMTDDDGRYVASQEDFTWWEQVISEHEYLDRMIATYKSRFDSDEVDQVVQDWAAPDLDLHPVGVMLGLVETFGELS